MEILNHHIIEIFKILVMIQFSLFGLLFIIILGYIFYRDHLAKLKLINRPKIDKILTRINKVKPEEEQFLIKNHILAFNQFYQMEQKGKLSSDTCRAILKKYFLHSIPKLVSAKDWYLRQVAAMILQLKYKYLPTEIGDEFLFKKLLLDDTPLVVINAALAICNGPSQILIDLLIETFVYERRSQYDLLRLILKEGSLKIAFFIIEHLHQVKEIDSRALCYRMLSDLPQVSLEIPTLEQDLKSENLDLSIASLEYMVHSKYIGADDLIIDLLKSPIWQIRARSAKLVGRTGNKSFAKYLEPLLVDKEWWVRLRAAEALRTLGAEGLKILKRQKDPFAKDIAMQQIELMQQQQGK